MRCARCIDLESQIEMLEGQKNELRLQAMELAAYASELKTEIRHYLALLGLPLPDASTAQSSSPGNG